MAVPATVKKLLIFTQFSKCSLPRSLVTAVPSRLSRANHWNRWQLGDLLNRLVRKLSGPYRKLLRLAVIFPAETAVMYLKLSLVLHFWPHISVTRRRRLEVETRTVCDATQWHSEDDVLPTENCEICKDKLATAFSWKITAPATVVSNMPCCWCT